jgi:hypothetical protein
VFVLHDNGLALLIYLNASLAGNNTLSKYSCTVRKRNRGSTCTQATCMTGETEFDGEASCFGKFKSKSAVLQIRIFVQFDLKFT